MSGFFTDKDKNLFQFADGNDSVKYCLPVGTIFSSAIPLTDSSVHLLDGTTISQTGVYQEFAMLLKSLVSAGYNITCSQEDFDNAVSLTGNCGKFVIDNDTNTIRLPKITRFIQGLSNMINIGDSVEAGLPNITGELDFSSSIGFPSSADNVDGSAITRRLSSRANYMSSSSSTANRTHGINFNANRNNKTYGKSDTVQPQATSYPYYIVLASGFNSDVKINIDNILNDLNNKASKTEVNSLSMVLDYENQIDISVSSTTTIWQNTTGKNGYVYVCNESSNSTIYLTTSPDSNKLATDVCVIGLSGESSSASNALFIPVPKNWYCRIKTGAGSQKFEQCKFISTKEI